MGALTWSVRPRGLAQGPTGSGGRPAQRWPESPPPAYLGRGDSWSFLKRCAPRAERTRFSRRGGRWPGSRLRQEGLNQVQGLEIPRGHADGGRLRGGGARGPGPAQPLVQADLRGPSEEPLG